MSVYLRLNICIVNFVYLVYFFAGYLVFLKMVPMAITLFCTPEILKKKKVPSMMHAKFDDQNIYF